MFLLIATARCLVLPYHVGDNIVKSTRPGEKEEKPLKRKTNGVKSIRPGRCCLPCSAASVHTVRYGTDPVRLSSHFPGVLTQSQRHLRALPLASHRLELQKWCCLINLAWPAILYRPVACKLHTHCVLEPRTNDQQQSSASEGGIAVGRRMQYLLLACRIADKWTIAVAARRSLA